MAARCSMDVGCDEAGVCYAAAHGQPERCPRRPDQPPVDQQVWHRGWEVGYDYQAGFWSGAFWRAYKGGCDLDAKEVSGRTYQECLDAIDDEEDE